MYLCCLRDTGNMKESKVNETHVKHINDAMQSESWEIKTNSNTKHKKLAKFGCGVFWKFIPTTWSACVCMLRKGFELSRA